MERVVASHSPCMLPTQLVKEYPEGKMSKHICSLDVGQGLECKGPIPKLPYKPNMKKRIGMVNKQHAAHISWSTQPCPLLRLHARLLSALSAAILMLHA